MSPIEALLKATAFIDQHLTELCQEMVKYKESGVHEGGRIGEATKLLVTGTGINAQNSRSIVENAIALAAMSKCAGLQAKPESKANTYVRPEPILSTGSSIER